LGFTVLSVCVLSGIERAVIPTVLAVSEAKVAGIANQALVNAINDNIEILLKDRKLLDFQLGPDGEVLYVQTNATELNKIQAQALSVLQEALKDLEGFNVYVPFGQILGSQIFASWGPKIKLTLFPYGVAHVQVIDSFNVTGINQTRYSISLRVTYTVQVVIPLISSKTQITSEIPLVTVLIPGKVPNTYLSLPGSSFFGENLARPR